jgi:hypothetical protein
MSVTDLKMAQASATAKHEVSFPITTAVSQTGQLVGAFTPGYKFQITKVSVFASGVTATASVDVQIAGTTALASVVTPVAGTETVGTLATALTAKRGSATQQLQVKLTTNASGAATNLLVTVQFRPYPLNGEV